MMAPYGALLTVRRRGRFTFSNVHVRVRRGSCARTKGGHVLVIVVEGDVNGREASRNVVSDVRGVCERLNVRPDESSNAIHVCVAATVSRKTDPALTKFYSSYPLFVRPSVGILFLCARKGFSVSLRSLDANLQHGERKKA